MFEPECYQMCYMATKNAAQLRMVCSESHRLLAGAGIQWSRLAAERMLIIRAAVMTDTVVALWAAAPKLTASGECTLQLLALPLICSPLL